MKRLIYQPLFWWSLIIIAAFAVYFSGITHESIWYNEAYSAMMASHSLFEIPYYTIFDNHPPLYYMLLSIVVHIFGNSEWALRSLSALAAVGLVALGAGPVRRVFGIKTGLIFSIVILFTPAVLIYAHEARMYTLAMLSVTAAGLYGFLAAKYNKTGDWVGFGIASLASAYLHYYGLMAAVFMHLFIFICILVKNRTILKPYLITGIAVVVGYAPWLFSFYKQVSDVNKGFWIAPLSWNDILAGLIKLYSYKDIYPGVQPNMIVVAIFAAGLAVAGLVIAKRKKARDEWLFGWFMLLIYVCSFISPIILSLFSSPIFYSRYIFVVDGLLLLLVSLGISQLPNKILSYSALGLFVVVNLFTIKNIYTDYFNYPMRQLIDEIRADIQPGDLVITSDDASMGPAVYYLPQAVHYYSENSIEAQWGHVLNPYGTTLHGDTERDQLLAGHKYFWYITCSNMVVKNIATILKDKKGWEPATSSTTVHEPYSSISFTATKYIFTGRDASATQGTLNVHITDLKPPGNLFVIVFVTDPLAPYSVYRADYISISGREMTYAIDGLDYGAYMVGVVHDENKNYNPDFDKDGNLIEGIGFVNQDKMDFYKPETIKYDLARFNFNTSDITVETSMKYPPFPWVNKK